MGGQRPQGTGEQHGAGEPGDEQPLVAPHELHGAPQRPGRPRLDRLQRQQAFEVVGEVVGGGVAVARIGLHRLLHDDREVVRDLAGAPPQRRHAAGFDVLQHLVRAAAAVRRAVRQRFVQGDAERVDVGARVDAAVAAAQPLGRGVDRRAGELAAGDVEVALQRQAEVGEHRRAVGAQQDVRWLDVAVHEAGAVHFAEGSRDADGDAHEPLDRAARTERRWFAAEHGGQRRQRLRLRALLQPRDQALQAHAVDVLHLERQHLGVVDDAVHVHDVVVAQLRQCARFLDEALLGVRRHRQRVR